jgi:hypothetical protein
MTKAESLQLEYSDAVWLVCPWDYQVKLEIVGLPPCGYPEPSYQNPGMFFLGSRMDGVQIHPRFVFLDRDEAERYAMVLAMTEMR